MYYQDTVEQNEGFFEMDFFKLSTLEINVCLFKQRDCLQQNGHVTAFQLGGKYKLCSVGVCQLKSFHWRFTITYCIVSMHADNPMFE